jgi:transcription elongation GreA/GreB family factor
MSKSMNPFKSAVYQTAIAQLKQKEALLAEERKNIIESILEEEKNSAGDKYETSRENMTQDLNSLEKQIKQSKLDLEELYRLQSIKDTPPTVQEGALVQLGSDWFLLAVSVGQVKVEDKQVFLLSKNSPLGELLLGKKKNEAIQFRGKPQTITELV